MVAVLWNYSNLDLPYNVASRAEPFCLVYYIIIYHFAYRYLYLYFTIFIFRFTNIAERINSLLVELVVMAEKFLNGDLG